MNTTGRRRRQAVGGYKHVSPRQRPHYLKIDVVKSQRRLKKRIETERRMKQKAK